MCFWFVQIPTLPQCYYCHGKRVWEWTVFFLEKRPTRDLKGFPCSQRSETWQSDRAMCELGPNMRCCSELQKPVENEVFKVCVSVSFCSFSTAHIMRSVWAMLSFMLASSARPDLGNFRDCRSDKSVCSFESVLLVCWPRNLTELQFIALTYQKVSMFC